MVEHCVRFAPSRVEGLSDVWEVAVYPDRFELRSAGEWQVFRFQEFAKWPGPAWPWKWLSRLGVRPRWLPVADRDWFHPPRERFFRFYTQPPIVVFLADEDRALSCDETLFRRVQDVMQAGGFHSCDLG